MSQVLAIVSQKGGVGKTSLVQNLGAELAVAGQRVLLVDFDPQANLTEGWGIDPAADVATVYHAMLGMVTVQAARITLRERLDLLPASLDLAGADPHFAGELDRYYKLSQTIEPILAEYDFVLIDSPPSLGYFVNSALMAADAVLIPLQVHAYAYKALDQLLAIVGKAAQINKALAVQGIVLTMYDRRNNLTTSVEEAARERFGDLIYQTVIPVNVRIAEAPLDGQPVGEMAADSAGAAAYAALAKEILTNG